MPEIIQSNILTRQDIRLVMAITMMMDLNVRKMALQVNGITIIGSIKKLQQKICSTIVSPEQFLDFITVYLQRGILLWGSMDMNRETLFLI